MNTQLVESIVQMIDNLPFAERELVKQKLSAPRYQEATQEAIELTLDDRKAFLRKPLAER